MQTMQSLQYMQSLQNMQDMQNMQNMQNSYLLTERNTALWAVYGHFYSQHTKACYTTTIVVNITNRIIITIIAKSA